MQAKSLHKAAGKNSRKMWGSGITLSSVVLSCSVVLSRLITRFCSDVLGDMRLDGRERESGHGEDTRDC